MDLPETLKASPNIPWRLATLAQLQEERDYWQSKIDAATSWGAAVGQCQEFVDEIQMWIGQREAEAEAAQARWSPEREEYET